MSFQQSINQMLTTAQHATGLKKIIKGQEEQAKSIEKVAADNAKIQEKLFEQKVAKAAEEQEYKHKQAQAQGYADEQMQHEWETEFEKEDIRQQMAGEKALGSLIERINFLSAFNESKKTRQSVLLGADEKPLKVEV